MVDISSRLLSYHMVIFVIFIQYYNHYKVSLFYYYYEALRSISCFTYFSFAYYFRLTLLLFMAFFGLNTDPNTNWK